MTREEVKKLILSTKGQIFRVTFVKRTTNELRTMQARLGVKKHLKGGEAAYSFGEKDLISVFDVANGGYRSIPVENILEVRIGGEVFNVV